MSGNAPLYDRSAAAFSHTERAETAALIAAASRK